ncbi:IS607-like element IS1535 family transposase [Dactylosporangium darangshiense]|uniref:IS607-like element IS1535 family transposase n=1 Tax=Dactylosporangium darangshiense TaxID=579108 RepID=A0ABP8DD17_9ACTN
MKLAEWERRQGVSYQTAWRWVKDGKLPVPVRQAPSGTWIVEEPRKQVSGCVVAYCRVSSADQKPDLDRQVARVVTEAGKRGLAVSEVVTEVGSGLNGKHRTLHRVLADPHVAVVVVEHRNRLARFGVEHLQAALSATGRELVVLDPEETTDDLVKDMTDVLTSMCARRYGQRPRRTAPPVPSPRRPQKEDQ